MSRDWTQVELQRASTAMKVAEHMGYEEFCEALRKDALTAFCKDEKSNLIKIENFLGSKDAFRDAYLWDKKFHLKITPKSDAHNGVRQDGKPNYTH